MALLLCGCGAVAEGGVWAHEGALAGLGRLGGAGGGVDYKLFEVVGEGGEEGGRGGGGGGRRGGFCFGSEARDDDAAGFIGFGLGWGLGEHGQGEESA